MTTVAHSPAQLLDLAGADLGITDWVPLEPEQLDRFARATGGDRADPAMLALSLVNLFLPRLLEVRGASMGVNVGLDRVRFPSPLPPAGRLRAGGRVLEATESRGGVQVVVRVVVEAEAAGGAGEPVCEADTVSRFLP